MAAILLLILCICIIAKVLSEGFTWRQPLLWSHQDLNEDGSDLDDILDSVAATSSKTATIETVKPPSVQDIPRPKIRRNFPSPLLKWSTMVVSDHHKDILHLGSGKIYPGRVLGILGPSGSGKTTLLHVLGNRKDRGPGLKYTNDMKVIQRGHNAAEKADKETFTSGKLNGDDIAFVYQHDSFFSMLTVSETIYFTAALTRLNSRRKGQQSKVSTKEIVNEVIETLALSDIRSSRIGSPDDPTVRGVSGGERKRVAVACEIVGHPQLLLADEPTSGLDAFQAEHVVHRLSELAEAKSLAVVVTVHQPRTSIWERLDDILILAPGGREIFHGPRQDILPYLTSLGYECPANVNPAEYIIGLVSLDTTDMNTMEKSSQRINELAAAFSKYNSLRMANDEVLAIGYGDFEDEDYPTSSPSEESTQIASKGSPSALSGPLSLVKGSLSLIKSITINPAVYCLKKTGRSVYRFGMLLQRSLRQSLRNLNGNFIQFAVSGILALTLYSVYGTQPDGLTEDSVSNRVIILSNAVINICLLSMITTLQLFKREKSVVSRERHQGLYTAHEYLLAKVVAELPVTIGVASFFGYVLHQTTNLRCDVKEFMGILSVLSAVTSTLGLAIGSIFQKGEAALSIGPGLMIIFLITGAIGPTGVGDALPSSLQLLRTLSPIKWGCEAVAAAEFRDQYFEDSMALSVPRRGPLSMITRLLRLGGSDEDMPTPEGDMTLEALGIGDATVLGAIMQMGKMLLGNLFLSWLGLIFTKGK